MNSRITGLRPFIRATFAEDCLLDLSDDERLIITAHFDAPNDPLGDRMRRARHQVLRVVSHSIFPEQPGVVGAEERKERDEDRVHQHS